jgi:hypothetical protein
VWAIEPPFVLVLVVVLVLEFGLWSGVELILRTGLRESFLSRRDQVIVAWQFTVRGWKKPNPSRRERYDWVGKEPSSTLNGEPVSRPTQTVPSGTGLFCKRIPASELPGYLQLVPPGRNPRTCLHFLTPLHTQQSRTRTTTSTRAIRGAASPPSS